MEQLKNFDWMLEGCHHISEIAVAYYPNYASDNSSIRVLRRTITEHAALLEALTAQGYTRKQIGIIVYYWGLPSHVKDCIEKNPYLAVPKKCGKI
jgi:hypothetical protein